MYMYVSFEIRIPYIYMELAYSTMDLTRLLYGFSFAVVDAIFKFLLGLSDYRSDPCFVGMHMHHVVNTWIFNMHL
jgi:hypothetical protein